MEKENNQFVLCWLDSVFVSSEDVLTNLSRKLSDIIVIDHCNFMNMILSIRTCLNPYIKSVLIAFTKWKPQ